MTSVAVSRLAGVDAGGAIRTHASGFDPYRACVGLAGAAAARGALIFEQSAARKFRPSRKLIEVVTEGGTIRAAAAIVTASGAPGLQSLRRHLRSRHIYSVVTERLPAAVRRQVGPRERRAARRQHAAARAPLDRRRAGVVHWSRAAARSGPRDRESPGAAQRSVDVRALDDLSAGVWRPRGMDVDDRLRRQRRWFALHRSAPQFSAPALRARPRPSWRRRGVACRPRAAAAVHG